MSYDSDFDSDSYFSEENEFYTGYRSPADEWQVTRQSLFKEFNGSVFTANDKISRRLARLNEIIAFSESKDTKRINKKNYISDNYSFLQEFIPESIFEKITEIMTFTLKEKKKIAKDIGLNVETLATFLSLWQLELYSTGNFIAESTLNEINVFLKESSTYATFRRKGHITSKDIERCESRILRQLYNETVRENNLSKNNELPGRVLEYYRNFIIDLDQYLNDNQKKLQERNPLLPYHVYLLAQKKELLKKILPKISLEYFTSYIELKDLETLGIVIEEFYKDKNAMVGELVAQAIVLIEQYFHKIAIIDNMPKKFRTRVKKYRNDFSLAFKLSIDTIRDESHSNIVETPETHKSQYVLEVKKEVNHLTEVDGKELEIDEIKVNQRNDTIPYVEFLDFSKRQRSILRNLGIPDQFHSLIATTFVKMYQTFTYEKTKEFLFELSLFISLVIFYKLFSNIFSKFYFRRSDNIFYPLIWDFPNQHYSNVPNCLQLITFIHFNPI